MAITTEGWFLHAGDGPSTSPANLVRERFELDDLHPDEVLAEPLYGCWEGNMGHSVQRRPVDICRERHEAKVVIGNAGVVRIAAVGRNGHRFFEGQLGIIFSAAVPDELGYPRKILGYDAPNTMGCLAKRIKLHKDCFMPIPQNSKYSLPQWAAFSVRYVTAWSNWELAYGTYRLMAGRDEVPHPHVWGWGGGTALATIDLARLADCNAVMISGNPHNIRTIQSMGISTVDRNVFGNLSYDEARFASDSSYRRQYLQGEREFLQEVRKRTDGTGVHIFVDHIGTATARATMRALARNSVVTTAGWKAGMAISLLRAVECIERHQHIHTHYARYPQGVAAVAFAEEHGWLPPIDGRIYGFDEINELSQDYLEGRTGMFPIYSVNGPERAEDRG